MSSAAYRSRGTTRGLGDTVASPDPEDEQMKQRLKELSRRHGTEESQSTLRMQRQQIEKLKRDNERLKEDLALETRQAKQANNMTASSQIAKLQDQGDMYQRKIIKERERVKKLNEQLSLLNDAMLEQRKKMGGVNAFRQNNQAVQKQIRILENRLDKALVKFNEALAHNTQLRNQIESLRRERSVFDEIYKKLDRELQDKKAKMEQIISVTNEAYQNRDEAQGEMVSLKEQADRDQVSFEEEWRDLKSAIEDDRQKKAFIKHETSNQAALLALMGPESKNKNALVAGGSSGLAPQEEARLLREKVKKGTEDVNKDSESIRAALAKVQTYEEAFAKIQKATQITDIDELVNTFVTAEDVSFRMFNYVNDLSSEIERLEESVAATQRDITKLQEAGNDSTKKKMLVGLESQLTDTEKTAHAYEARYDESVQTMSRLKEGINAIFHKISCSALVAPELLGSTGVTESNMMQYLGVIEQRTNELLAMYRSQQARGQEGGKEDDLNAGSSRLGGQTVPSLTDYGAEEDDEDEEHGAVYAARR